MENAPQLTIEEIEAILNGTADDALKIRVENNPDYQQQVEEARQVNTMLMDRLYRYNCPDQDDLIDYQKQLLPENRKKQIKQHLEICPYCPQEMEELMVLWDDSELSSNETLEKIIPISDHPLYQVGKIMDLPARRKVRGEPTGNVFRLQIEGDNVIVNIKGVRDGQRVNISLEVIGDDIWENALAYLEQSDGTIRTARIDDEGMGTFSVNVGKYSLRIVSEAGGYLIANDIQFNLDV